MLLYREIHRRYLNSKLFCPQTIREVRSALFKRRVQRILKTRVQHVQFLRWEELSNLALWGCLLCHHAVLLSPPLPVEAPHQNYRIPFTPSPYPKHEELLVTPVFLSPKMFPRCTCSYPSVPVFSISTAICCFQISTQYPLNSALIRQVEKSERKIHQIPPDLSGHLKVFQSLS